MGTEPQAPTEPQEPQEPTEPIEPTEPTEPQEPAEPTEPTEPQEPLTQANIDTALENFTHKFQSWLGRREQEQDAKFTQMIKDSAQPTEPSGDPTEEAFTDPSKWLTSELDKRDSQASVHTRKVMDSAVRMMDSDPLFSQTTPGGREFGTAVVKQVAQTLANVKPGMDVEQGAEMLINRATLSVMRGLKPTNPLSKNKPSGAPLGTVDPKTPEPKKPKMPEISEQMRKYQEARGLSDEKMDELVKKTE